MCKDFQNGKDKGALKNVIDHHNHGLRYWKASSKLKIPTSMLRTVLWKWKEHVLTTNLFWKLNPFVWDCSWKGYWGSHYRKNFENFYPIYLSPLDKQGKLLLLFYMPPPSCDHWSDECDQGWDGIWIFMCGSLHLRGINFGVVEQSMCYGRVPQCVVPATHWV